MFSINMGAGVQFHLNNRVFSFQKNDLDYNVKRVVFNSTYHVVLSQYIIPRVKKRQTKAWVFYF